MNSATSVSFEIVGTAMPKGSKTAVVRENHAVLLDARRGPSRKAYREWTRAVEVAGRVAMGQTLRKVGRGFVWDSPLAPFDGPLAITATFYIRRPAHETRAQRGRTWHATKPDADKLLRAVLDPLSQIVITDDARISSARLEKRYVPYAAQPAAARVCITISCLFEGDNHAR